MKIAVEYMPITRLQPAPRNARIHSEKQRKKIRQSIKNFGFLVPIVIGDDNRIIAGHARVDEAKALDIAEVPAIRASHLSPAQIEAFALAENRISDEASFSKLVLREILADLKALDVDFDLAETGFDTGEIDLILLEGETAAEDPPCPAVDRSRPAVSRPGDCWQIDRHKVACGDARDAALYATLLWAERVRLVIADVVYNLPIQGMVSGNGRIQHTEFAMGSGEMSPAEFTAFLSEVSARLVEVSLDGAIHFIFMDFRHMQELPSGAGPQYSELKNLCVWVKPNGGMGSLYRSRHELIFVFKVGTAQHINNVELGRHGRNRTNVWEYAGANSFGPQRDDLKLHPTVKPVDMLADAIMDCSNRDDIVLDPFLGSGSTILAAHRTGRRGRGIEIDPHYVDLAVRRIAEATGCSPILMRDGRSFDAVAAERRNFEERIDA